jgi:hypothetical protein
MSTQDTEITQSLCEARLAKKGYYINFGNKKGRCYLEFRCNKKAEQTSGLCTSCQTKNPNCRTQDTRTFQHGRVWEPIPEKSQIFGSPWYYESLEKNGEPLSTDIETALQHQKEARKGFPQIEYMPPQPKNKTSSKNTIKDAFDMSSSTSSLLTVATTETAETTESVTSKSTGSKKSKKDQDLSEKSERSEKSKRQERGSSSANNEKRAAPKRKVTAPTNDFTVTLPVQLPEQMTLFPIYVEEIEEPYEIAEIEYLNLQEFEYNDDLYYKCNEDNRIFEYLRDGGIGNCIGVYEDGEIIDINDCEIEEEYS